MIPEKILDVVRNYSSDGEESQKQLLCAVLGQIPTKKSAKDADIFVEMVLRSFPLPLPPSMQSSSPHAPISGRKKMPYWFKVVTSYDPKTPNGYGIKGKFISKDKLHEVDDNEIIVACLKDGNDKSYTVLKPKKGGMEVLPFPNSGNPMKLDGVVKVARMTDDIRDLFLHLNKHNIKQTGAT
jgi:hypothetical protein